MEIDALPPDTYGWKLTHDDSESTPPCELAGLPKWTSPRIVLRQGTTEVRVIAVSHRTPGSTQGCVFEPFDAALSCPNLTTSVLTLTRQLGTRRLVFEQFPDA